MPAVDLIPRQVQLGALLVVRYQELDDSTRSRAVLKRQEVPHLPGIDAAAWRCEVQPVQYPVSLRMVHPTDIAAERQLQIIPIHDGGHELERIRRELDEGLGLRHMFITQGDKTVVCRYEEIVAGDVRLVVERRPMGFHLLREVIPEQLRLVRDGTPGLHRSLMHTRVSQLASSARENRLALLSGIALPVPVIQGGLTGRSEAVGKEYVGPVPGHSASITLGLNCNNAGPSRLYKFSKTQRLKQEFQHPQRRQPLPLRVYIYTLSPASGREMPVDVALMFGRVSPGWPMVLSSLLAAGMVCEGFAGGG